MTSRIMEILRILWGAPAKSDYLSKYVDPKLLDFMEKNPAKRRLYGDMAQLTMMAIYYDFYKQDVEMSKYVDTYVDVVDMLLAREATIDYMQDSYLFAYYNYPVSIDDHEKAAVKAAVDILGHTRKSGDKYSPCIAIHTDRFAVGNIGSPNMMNLTVSGDGKYIFRKAVNVKAAEEWKLIITDTVYSQVNLMVSTTYLDEIEHGGKRVKLYGVTA